MFTGIDDAASARHGEIRMADFNDRATRKAHGAFEPDRNGGGQSAGADKAPRMYGVKSGSLGDPARKTRDKARLARRQK